MIKDAERRKDVSKRVKEEEKSKESSTASKKISHGECDKIYEKHADRWKARNDAIEKKRLEKEYREELELHDMKMHQKKTSPSKDFSAQLLNRMDADIKTRKERTLALMKEKQKQEDEQVIFHQKRIQYNNSIS